VEGVRVMQMYDYSRLQRRVVAWQYQVFTSDIEGILAQKVSSRNKLNRKNLNEKFGFELKSAQMVNILI